MQPKRLLSGLQAKHQPTPRSMRRSRTCSKGNWTMELLHEPETWVAIAFVIFVCGLGYLGVHKTASKALDDRAGRIQAELDEARRLKDEAAQLLAEYQSKRQAAEGEAKDLIEGAKAEAERLA